MGTARSESIAALAGALAKAQGEIEGASKDRINPHFKAKYADLASVWDACREALSKHGLAVLQPVSADGATVTVTTILTHGSGEWLSSDLAMTAQQNTPQGLGSCITYARRYALASMVGIAPEDDDAEAASESRNGDTREPWKPSRPQAVPVATTPAGFDEWLADLEAVADEGGERLFATWNASKPEHRTYLTKTNLQKWEAIKAKSVGAAQSHPPPRPTPSPSPKRTTRGEPANG